MIPVKIKADKYGRAIALLLKLGGGFQTRFERTLIVTQGQRRALEQHGFVAPNGAGQKLKIGGGKKSLPIFLWCAFSVGLLTCGESNLNAQGKAQVAELWFYANAEKTTEMTGDDLYLLLCENGGKPRRLPERGHWSVSEQGNNRKIVKPVFKRELRDGEKVKILLVILVEDNGMPAWLMEGITRVGQTYAKSKSKSNKAAAQVVSAVGELTKRIVGDEDDLLGTLAITLENRDGKIITSVSAAQHGTAEQNPIFVDGLSIPNFRIRRGSRENYHIGIWQGGVRLKEPETHK